MLKKHGLTPRPVGVAEKENFPYVVVNETDAQAIYTKLKGCKDPPLCVVTVAHSDDTFSKIEWPEEEEKTQGFPFIFRTNLYCAIGAGGTAYFSDRMTALELRTVLSGFIGTLLSIARDNPDEVFDKITWYPDPDTENQ